MEIVKGKENHIQAIIKLAKLTWFATYSSLVPEEQISYMLDLFYNEELLKEQMNDPQHHFLVLFENDVLLGYAHSIEMEAKMKLSKLYVLPDMHGKGCGRKLLNAVETEAKQSGFNLLELCVNRGNPAQYFYVNMGFVIQQEIDIPIGDYWMNDYLMQKDLKEKF